MVAKKPLVRYVSGPGLQEVQLASSDLSDGPFATSNGSVQRILGSNLVIAAGYSYVVNGPLDLNGHTVTINTTGRVRVMA